jgi:hypothetical protein
LLACSESLKGCKAYHSVCHDLGHRWGMVDRVSHNVVEIQDSDLVFLTGSLGSVLLLDDPDVRKILAVRPIDLDIHCQRVISNHIFKTRQPA